MDIQTNTIAYIPTSTYHIEHEKNSLIFERFGEQTYLSVAFTIVRQQCD